MSAIKITEKNFKKEIENYKEPIVLSFYSRKSISAAAGEWTADSFAVELNGKVKVGKINVSDSRRLARRFNIRFIPTVLIIKNGRVADTVAGNVGKPCLLKILFS